MEFFVQLLLLDIPEAVLLLFVGCSLFHIPLRKEWKRLILCGIVFALWGDFLTYIGVNYQVKLILFFTGQMVLFWILGFRYLAMAMSMGSASWMMMSESILGWLLNYSGIDLEVFATSSLFRYVLSYTYLTVIASLGIILYLIKFNLRSFWPKTHQNRYLLLLLVSGGLSFVSILLINISGILADILPESVIAVTANQWIYQLVALILMSITAVVFFLYVRATIQRVENETEAPFARQLNDLTTAVHSIKHDSLNHYQVIIGFLKLKNYDMITDYIQQLIIEARQIIDVVHGVKNPTVSAMLYSKMAIYAGNEIDLRLNISPQAPQFSEWKSIHISKVLGNLLDNAMTATQKLEPEDRYILVEWIREGNNEILVVENSGPTIDETNISKVFGLGYTTRKSGKGGVGLSVVASLVKKYRGQIEVTSVNGITRFTISVPCTGADMASA
ncbi:sensor histidine kinase [Brevibacillus reuszeri]|uniref:sensor histidine kinase n=1 Tax=Brevibacillus reuszeri TaxID=54915 RepID=UPI000CCC6C65|nr:ATP-binding protein [Brevibacillus reuszeri]